MKEFKKLSEEIIEGQQQLNKLLEEQEKFIKQQILIACKDKFDDFSQTNQILKTDDTNTNKGRPIEKVETTG